MIVRLIASPWAEAFEQFGRSIRHQALLVAPFIGRQPLERLSEIINRNSPPQVDILTNLAVDSMLQGLVDVSAISSFVRRNSLTTVRHLPGLHAKAYVADDHLAIITSGNLTSSSLSRNYEYGIQINEGSIVTQISQDLRGYAALGAEVSVEELDQIAGISEKLRAKHDETIRASRIEVRREFERQLEVARESLLQVRARPGETTHAIFARTILFILRNGPLTTQQINVLVEGIHPDLCDNSIDRVINGVHFGRKWKHMVRTSQVFLRRKGSIELHEKKWHLVQEGSREG